LFLIKKSLISLTPQNDPFLFLRFQETFKAQEKEITGIKTDSQVLKKQINQMAELMEMSKVSKNLNDLSFFIF